MKRQYKKKSLKKKLLIYFLLLSIVPVGFAAFTSYYHNAKIVKENSDELHTINVGQISENTNVLLESYEDLLYQIYTDDNIIALIDKINNGEDLPVTKNQLRRTLRGLLNSKDYVRSISIITDNRTIVTYNQISPVSIQDAWIKNYSLSQDEIFKLVSTSNKTKILKTEYATSFASEDYFLFHLAHRMVDYKDIERKNGVAILSIDEKLLKKTCRNGNTSLIDTITFIVDGDGNIISFPDSKKINEKIVVNQDLSILRDNLQKFVNKTGLFKNNVNSIYQCYNDELNWNFIVASDYDKTLDKLVIQRNYVLTVSIISVIIIFPIVILITTQLTGSINKVVMAIKKVGNGDLETRIDIDNDMPLEIETIANQFNETLCLLGIANENEREANRKQRNAEIAALEAQLNPHFLYNTLDTINWMAIDKSDFEISNAINSLAEILRYAIDNSNAVVLVRDEINWLKNYIFLQQTRLKNTFECNMHIESCIYDLKIHKLLLQPFIENTLIHGFEGVKRKHILTVEMNVINNYISICIKDNGKGIEPSILKQINKGVYVKTSGKNHSGLENAIGRIHMYYGEQAKVTIKSIHGEGTQIDIRIPLEVCHNENCCN